MPAIRYYPNGVCANVLTHVPVGRATVFSATVEVRTVGGDFERLPWQGFICIHALPFMGDGRFCKIICKYITDGDGVLSDWRTVERGGYVVGWMRSGLRGRPEVHGIVGRDAFPVVVSPGGLFSDPGLRDYVIATRAREWALGDGAA